MWIAMLIAYGVIWWLLGVVLTPVVITKLRDFTLTDLLSTLIFSVFLGPFLAYLWLPDGVDIVIKKKRSGS